MAEQQEQKQGPWFNGSNSPIGVNSNNDQWNNNNNSNPEQNDGGLSNDDEKMQDNQPIRIMDVSELEKVHNAEKAALEEKEAKALLQLEEYLDQKVNALIEIGKHHIDTMEGYIGSLILSKLSCKVIEQCSEKCRSYIASILQTIWTPALKKQLLQNMQVQLKNYMTQVAKVYDVGLTHFKEHTYEAQSMAGLNAEKIKQLCHELLCLQGVDSDVVKDLSEQCDSEYEELKNAKEITDMVGKQMGVLNAFKDKHSVLDNAVDSLTSQYIQKKQVLQNHIQKSVNEAIQREYSMQYVMKLKQQQQAMMYRQQLLQQQQQQQQQQQLLIPNFLNPQIFNGQNAAAASSNNNSGDIGNLNLFGLNSIPSWFGMNSNEEDQQQQQMREQDRQDEQGDIFEDAEEEEEEKEEDKQGYYHGEEDEQGEEHDEEDEDGHGMNELDGESGSTDQLQQQQVVFGNTTEEDRLGQYGQSEESNENQKEEQQGMINNAAMDNYQQQQQQLPVQQQRVIGTELQKLQEKLQSPDFLNQYESAYTQYQQQLQEAEQYKEGGNKNDSTEIDQEQQQR